MGTECGLGSSEATEATEAIELNIWFRPCFYKRDHNQSREESVFDLLSKGWGLTRPAQNKLR